MHFAFFYEKRIQMKTFICLLRGINVSGKNSIKMADLKKMFEDIGATQVMTYIQSGNVVFHFSETGPMNLAQRISDEIKARFAFDVPALVMTSEKLKKLVAENPFVDDPAKDPAFLHLTFLASVPNSFDTEFIQSKIMGEEEFVFAGDVVYLYCPHGYGKTKLNNTFFENKLKVQATTRNLKTTLKLLDLSNVIE